MTAPTPDQVRAAMQKIRDGAGVHNSAEAYAAFYGACTHHGNRSRCLPCFQSDVLALCRDHQGMSAHMLAEAIADLCGVDLREEARARDDESGAVHPSFYDAEHF